MEVNQEAAQGEAGEKSPAQKIKFKLQFALLMLVAGRTDTAQEMFQQAFDMLDEMG
jgi:hypothetical protein